MLIMAIMIRLGFGLKCCVPILVLMGNQIDIMMCWTCVCTNVLLNPFGQHCSIASVFIFVHGASERNVYRVPGGTAYGVFHSVGTAIINIPRPLHASGSLAEPKIVVCTRVKPKRVVARRPPATPFGARRANRRRRRFGFGPALSNSRSTSQSLRTSSSCLATVIPPFVSRKKWLNRNRPRGATHLSIVIRSFPPLTGRGSSPRAFPID
jgi:hypothetical protein